jgi:putative nucleotidyltransferase with HDIG domain
LERLFGLVSDWSLLELCSPEHPLLRELTLKAPGTYAHSVMVGNLAENAAREVGANAVLCRALAYFHDVGKLVRPSYFIENQRGFNPHDQIPPQLSARILIEHVKDGVELARKHRLPRVIQDGISQHHGTSLIAYFWNRAHEAESTAPITEDSFRYDGPKPQSKELAILHLSDSIEALSRSLNSSSTEEIEIAVRRVIEERRADGQLDECDLTFADLRKIEQSFLRSLGALRHERIAYPEEMTHATEKPSHYDLEQLRAAYPDEHPPHGA